MNLEIRHCNSEPKLDIEGLGQHKFMEAAEDIINPNGG